MISPTRKRPDVLRAATAEETATRELEQVRSSLAAEAAREARKVVPSRQTAVDAARKHEAESVAEMSALDDELQEVEARIAQHELTRLHQRREALVLERLAHVARVDAQRGRILRNLALTAPPVVQEFAEQLQAMRSDMLAGNWRRYTEEQVATLDSIRIDRIETSLDPAAEVARLRAKLGTALKAATRDKAKDQRWEEN